MVLYIYDHFAVTDSYKRQRAVPEGAKLDVLTHKEGLKGCLCDVQLHASPFEDVSCRPEV